METVKCKMSDDQFVNAIKELYSQKRTLLAIDADRVAEGVQIAINIIESLPSAGRPQGKWIYCEDYVGHDGYKCSECGFFVPWCYDVYADSNFIRHYHTCPHCDSRMKGEDNGEVIQSEAE